MRTKIGKNLASSLEGIAATPTKIETKGEFLRANEHFPKHLESSSLENK